MSHRTFSVILLPTLRCNADCAYCFEEKARARMHADQLAVVVYKLLDYVEQSVFDTLEINWQGGEIMLMGPEWFHEAHAIIRKASHDRSIRITHGLQSNMLLYHAEWNPILAEMFDNSVGTSFDYPNRHRLLRGKTEEYDRVWLDNVKAARDAGISVGVIAVPSRETLEMGAERFYTRFVDELGITDFQINTPFAGGPPSLIKQDYPLDPERLGQFLVDLANIWTTRDDEYVRIGPLDVLLDRFSNKPSTLPCIWHENCANEFVCIDPQGGLSLCDCWVSSFPESHFGNLLEDGGLATVLGQSRTRRELLSRPVEVMHHEDCIECDFLSMCHGGCPIRTYTLRGELSRKDPYCATYKIVFEHMRTLTRELLSKDMPPSTGIPLPIL